MCNLCTLTRQFPADVITDREELMFLSAVRSHHANKSTWQPIIGEQLQIERDMGYNHDHFAIAVIKVSSDGTRRVVGHVPRKLGYFPSHFLPHGGDEV